jgi:hypothetical protein
VQDVKNGLVDMSVGPFWITAERLKMVSFTVPLLFDKTMLVIENPGTTESFMQQAEKVFMPFTWQLWLLIIATIVVASLLSVWYSDRSLLMSARRGQRRRDVYMRLALDSCLQKGLFFCSAGVDQEEGATLPSKVLVSAYFLISSHCLGAKVAISNTIIVVWLWVHYFDKASPFCVVCFQ